jgi:SAM-dependent methyltransferase
VAEPAFVSATRASYDAIADYYHVWIDGELEIRPLERALLAAFVEMVERAGGGVIADVGCGQGRITAHLSGLGATTFGVDLSEHMVANARLSCPQLRFDVGSMLDLDVADATLAGIVAWYSIIHVPDDRLPNVFAEFTRALVPGGRVLIAFQVGDEVVHRDEAGGHAVSLDFHRRSIDQVVEMLGAAGLTTSTRVLRNADDDEPFPEKTAQGFLVARKSTTG